MNGRHLAAIVWLRWRLALKRWRRGSRIGAAITVVVAAASVMAGCAAFVLSLTVGVAVLKRALPDHLLLLWDGVVVAFLFFWLMGVVTELQRSEALSLDKLLHLPIELRSAFLLNYASSLVTMSLIVFVPAMLGLSLAMVIVHGAAMLVLLPLVATFLLMVTAVTYQFRGWLAALMVNKRRRGTILAVVTVGAVLMAQLPQLFNLAVMRSGKGASDGYLEAVQQVEGQRELGLIEPAEAARQLEELRELHDRTRHDLKQARLRQIVNVAVVVNTAVPVGWLPVGARAAAEHRLWPAALGSLGALLIGVVSLRRSYRTTLRLYTADFGRRRAAGDAPPPAARTAKPAASTARTRGRSFLERRLPGCSDGTAAVALASFRSFVRAPQAKLLLLTPVILLSMFAIILFTGRDIDPPAPVVPLLGLAVVGVTMLMHGQLVQNVFGLDRAGFRMLVLAPVERHEILKGKNLSVAPFVLVAGGIGLVLLQVVHPLHVTHLLASLLQLACVYVICCMVGNMISIVAPIAMSSGTFRPARPRSVAILKQLAFSLLLPLAMLPTAIPLGIELLLDTVGWGAGVPVYLVLSAAELALLLWLYRKVIRAQGGLLASREQRILEEVTASVE